MCAVANIFGGEIKYVVGEVLAVDCGSRMEIETGPIVVVLAVFARRGGAGTGSRPAWGVLAPVIVSICLFTEQPVARAVSYGGGAVSR